MLTVLIWECLRHQVHDSHDRENHSAGTSDSGKEDVENELAIKESMIKYYVWLCNHFQAPIIINLNP